MTADAQKLADELVTNCIVEFRDEGQYMAIPSETFFRVKAALASVRDAEPVAWIYKGDPYFDGRKWNDTAQVTTSKQLAMFNDSRAKPLYTHPTAHPSADELLREIAEHLEARNDDTGLDVIRQKLQARLARSAT